MGNNNAKTESSSSGPRTTSGNQEPQKPRVVYVQKPPAQDNSGVQYAASRVNNLPSHYPQNFPQNPFPHNEPFGHPSVNRVPNNRIYPNIPTAPEAGNGRQFFTNNSSGSNLQVNRESPNRMPVFQERSVPVMHPSHLRDPLLNRVPEVRERPKTTMDTSELLELSNKESSYIVNILKGKKVLFENTIKGTMSHSVLEVLMKIVRKICFADSYNDKVELLKVVCCDNFLNTLGIYILNVPTHQKDCAKEDILFLEGNVLPFFESILLLIPSLVCHKLRDLLIQTNLAINGLQQYHDINIDDATRMKLKKLESTVRLHLNPDSPDISNEEERTLPAKVQEPETEANKSKSGPSHSAQAQAKHLEFLSRNVFPSVINKLEFPAHSVKGVCRNIYFVDKIKNNEEGTVEGKFLLALAKFLLKQKQSYKANNILLLTTSNQEMKDIVEIKNKCETLKDLQVGLISSFDKFDAIIILISCSVNETDVQNIYCERQICQALLGAKNGVFMMGNLRLLENVSPFWKEMKRLLQQHEAVSSELPIFCESHQVVMRVSEVNDLRKLKNGACSRRCEKKLKCGHLCKRLCHFDDREHKQYKCREPCSRKPKKCSMNHKCTKLCHEPCGLCTMRIEENNNSNLCHELFIQQKKGEGSFPQTSTTQGKNSTNLLPCGHTDPRQGKTESQLDLWSPQLAALCQVPCSAVLECGHTCSGTCGTCRQGRVHLPCRNQGKITLVCGHRFVSLCSAYVQLCDQKCFYECPHGMCKEKCGIPCTPCKEPCTIGCEHTKCNKKCFELCDRRPCFLPCNKLLACGHKCISICGEPCPPGPENCRVCNAQKMKKRDSTGEARFVLLSNCNHVVRSNDLDRKAFSKVYKLEALACPLCGYNITKTTRYLNYAKELHRNLIVIRHVQRKYNENLTEEFWKIAKEIRSLSLPKEIENHTKIEEIKKQFQVVQETKVAGQKPLILIKFLRNLLCPIVDECTGLASPHHLDWLLILLLERYEMGICSQVLRELYKEVIEYQKLKGKVFKNHVLELHKAIAFFTYLEKNTWMKCAKGHLSTYNSLLTECGSCDGLN